MPWKSDQQRKWGHTQNGIKALGKKRVKEYDQMTKGMDLPAKKKPQGVRYVPAARYG